MSWSRIHQRRMRKLTPLGIQHAQTPVASGPSFSICSSPLKLPLRITSFLRLHLRLIFQFPKSSKAATVTSLRLVPMVIWDVKSFIIKSVVMRGTCGSSSSWSLEQPYEVQEAFARCNISTGRDVDSQDALSHDQTVNSPATRTSG